MRFSQSYYAVVMIAGFLAGLILWQAPLAARTIVDLPSSSPLGEVIVDEGNGYVYYSLGNGRAIRYSKRQASSQDLDELRERLLRREAGNGENPKQVPDIRRNVRWRR